MSAYITLLTPMTDRECLLHALADVGFGPDKVEVHAEPTCLDGYQGDRRTQKAHLVIRKQHLSAASNDLGVRRHSHGSSAHRQRLRSPNVRYSWVRGLEERYTHHRQIKEQRAAEEERRRIAEERLALVEAQRQAIHERAKKMGYRVEESRKARSFAWCS